MTADDEARQDTLAALTKIAEATETFSAEVMAMQAGSSPAVTETLKKSGASAGSRERRRFHLGSSRLAARAGRNVGAVYGHVLVDGS